MVFTIEEAAARRDRAIKAANELYERRIAEIRDRTVVVRRGRDWDRYLRVIVMRSSGATLKDIAEDQGVSAARAGQMIRLVKIKARIAADFKVTDPDQLAFLDKIRELNIDLEKL